MIVFLYGPDSYRREAKRRALTAAFLEKHSAMSVGRYDLEIEESMERCREFVSTRSLFDVSKLLCLQNVFAHAEESAAFLRDYLTRKDVIILLSEESAPKSSFSFLLKKPVLSESFAHLRGAPWSAFIEEIARERGLTLDGKTRALLEILYEGDTWRLVTELEKLALLGTTALTARDLARCDVELSPDFWETLRSLTHSERRVRLEGLERLFAMREPAAKVFFLLASLWTERATRFGAYDIAIKSGKLDFEEALVDLALL